MRRLERQDTDAAGGQKMILELIGVLTEILIVLGTVIAGMILAAWIIMTAPDDVEED